jgi:Secretion system C-terminal sorting domain
MKKHLSLLLITCVLWLPGFAQGPFTVYGLARNNSPAQLYLASLQPGIGLVTEISQSSIGQFFALNLFSAIDPVNDLFYYGPGSGVLYAVNMNTGITTDTVNLNLPAGTNFDMMQYNCADSSLYGIYSSGSPSGLYLAKVDLSTGQITVISPNPVASQSVLNAKSTIDPFLNVYYFQDLVSLKGIDLTTGLIVSQVPVSFSGPGQYFDLMTFNCGDGKIYGVNRVFNSPALYPAWVDPATGVVTNLSNTSMGTFLVLNAMSEINPFAGVFHFFNGTSFVSYDINTGNILASPQLTFSPSPGNAFFDLIARDNCKCVLSNPNAVVSEISTQQIKLFPNPVESGTTLTIQFNIAQNDRLLQVFNMQGKVIMQQEVGAGAAFSLISTENLSAGCYYASMEGGAPAKFIVH